MSAYNNLYRRVAQDSIHCGGMPLWLAFRCLPAIVVGSVLLLLLSAATVEAAPAN